MLVSLTVVRYPKLFIPLAFLSMAWLRLPLLFQKGLTFSKLMGCGRNGTFDITPDWQQWAFMGIWESEAHHEAFKKSIVWRWWRAMTTEQWTFLCTPAEAHGLWNGQEPFGKPEVNRAYDGPIAVLTRATIRPSKLRDFWRNVPGVASTMDAAPGFVTSVGIGEAPFIRQATFSIWQSVSDVKQFAYRQREHAEVIKKTRTNNWYSEELFARFIPLKSEGTIRGVNPYEI
jgi:hypothetical protein